MKHALEVAITFFLSTTILQAQPTIEWQHTFGGNKDEEPFAVIQTLDGGYAIAGYTASNNGDIFGSHGYYECWILKLDASGAVQWKKPYGGSDYELAYDIQQTPDGGYIFAGVTYSNNWQVSGNHGLSDMWVVKIDSNGVVQWQKTLGGTDIDEARAIRQTLDGGYVVAGYTESEDGDVSHFRGGRDYWVVKLSNLGEIEWERTFGGSGFDLCHSIAVCSDGGYIVAGQSDSQDGQVSSPIEIGSDYWVVKLNFDGKIEWEKSLGGNSSDYAFEVLENRIGGGYTVFGHAHGNTGQISGNHGKYDYWLVNLDETGEIVWQNSFGGSGEDYAGSFSQTSDGGYILIGGTRSSDGDVVGNDGGADMWVVKTDALGQLEWQKPLGGTKAEFGRAVQQTTDGGYIATGYSWSNDGDVTENKGRNDIWVVKLSSVTSPTQELRTETLPIYPNPASDKIYWQLPTSEADKYLNINVLNTFGQSVRQIPTHTGQSLDVSDLPAGLYLLELRKVSGERLLGRFLKE